MEILLIVLVAFIELLAFIIGVRIGQKVAKNEEIVIPTPRKIIKEIKEEKKTEVKQKELEANLKAIDEYEG